MEERRWSAAVKPTPSMLADGTRFLQPSVTRLYFCTQGGSGDMAAIFVSETDVTNQDHVNVTDHCLLFLSQPFKTENIHSETT